MPSSTASPEVTPRRRGRPRASTAGARASVADLLLSEAITQFAVHGYDAVGVRQIASHAGVDAAMIVHHFGSKLQLWQAAIDHLSHKMLGALGPIPADAPDMIGAAARLDMATAQIIDVLCDTPELSSFILREVVLENDRSDYSYARLVEPIHDRLAPLIAAYAAPSGQQLNPDYLFVALMGGIVSAVAARRLFDRMSPTPQDDGEFRDILKTTISTQLAARVGHAPRSIAQGETS